MKTVDIVVNQKPISVIWECPKCCYENKNDYGEFLSGEQYCDWEGSIVECEDCGNNCKIKNIDWD